MQNYFNYFTEIESRFQARRGSVLLLSTLDWALIETWREAGIPLEAVLRGIDDAFDKHDARLQRSSRRLRRINGLAWCAQSVIQATESMQAALSGGPAETAELRESGFEANRIVSYVGANAFALERSALHGTLRDTLEGIGARLYALADEIQTGAWNTNQQIEEVLTALEAKMFAALMLDASEDTLVALREQAARELAPHRAKMTASQLRQITEQFLHKRLLEQHGLPRLSLFYMPLAETGETEA